MFSFGVNSYIDQEIDVSKAGIQKTIELEHEDFETQNKAKKQAK